MKKTHYVCMIAYSAYINDGRIRRYAETLVQRGDNVDVICLASMISGDRISHINGVNLYQIQKRKPDELGPWSYALRQLRFLLGASILITKLDIQKKYDVVHVHNIPDFLVFSAWYPKIRGSKLILDIHDIVPELFADKFNLKFKKIYVSVLRSIEKISARFADHVIVSNDLWKEKLIARSLAADRCSVFVNNVDEHVFSRKQRTRNDGRCILIFPGSFQWHQGLDIAIRALVVLREKLPNVELHLYGGGNEKVERELRALTKELGLSDSVKFKGVAPIDNIAQIIANADVGVVPKRADSFGNEAYSTKIMEFMSQGVPVVASRTKIDSHYFSDDEVCFFPSGDSVAMAEAIWKVESDKEYRDSLIRRGLNYAEYNNW
jgi:glycosyltransferase involved in cell wall biosynthesis